MLINGFEAQTNYAAEQSKSLVEIFSSSETQASGSKKPEKVKKTQRSGKQRMIIGNIFDDLNRVFRDTDDKA
jgi:hypothetical protein